jgi:hypothetical protein
VNYSAVINTFTGGQLNIDKYIEKLQSNVLLEVFERNNENLFFSIWDIKG